MFNFQFTPTISYCLSYTAVLASLLCLTSCEQRQAVPVVPATSTPAIQSQPERYYLNSQPSTKTVIESLDPKTLTRMDVLRGQQAMDYTHDATANNVVLVQTK